MVNNLFEITKGIDPRKCLFFVFSRSIVNLHKPLFTSEKMKPISRPKTTIILFSLLSGILFLFTACKPGTKDGSSEVEELKDTVSDKEELVKNVVEYPIPSAFEVTQLLNEAGASYIISLSNPVENADKYITQKSKALNLGVYGADLSYASTYNQTQETMDYLKVSSRIIEDLAINTPFNEQLVERVENNLGNQDSLISIITDSFYDAYNYLRQNEQDNLSILVVAGSWIEAMYITTQMSIISQDNSQIVQIISNQRSSLKKLLELMEGASQDPMVAELFNDLKKVQKVYREAGEKLDEESLEKITGQTEKLRDKIIS